MKADEEDNMARFWVQRRVDDGLFWQRNGAGYGPLESARAYEQWEVRKVGPAAIGLEWVEINADGPPPKEGPARLSWERDASGDSVAKVGPIYASVEDDCGDGWTVMVSSDYGNADAARYIHASTHSRGIAIAEGTAERMARKLIAKYEAELAALRAVWP